MLKKSLKDLISAKGVLEHARVFKEDSIGNPCTVEFVKDAVVKVALCIQESDKLVEISKGVMKSTNKYSSEA